ncbi:MAG: helix-turn-helix domain-containing protein [Ancalomicrobiaceae bacterium]|nr:helix-turn-helix domain-containing protein [Ancalomicrobiaceae bacterium]
MSAASPTVPSRAVDVVRPTGTSSGSVIAARIAPGLSQRVWMIGRDDQKSRCHLFLIVHGRASYRGRNGSALDLGGPALLWLPRRSEGTFTLAAGGDGAMLDVKEDVVWRAVGEHAIAQPQQLILDRLIVAPAERLNPLLSEFRVIIDALIRETMESMPGGMAVVELYLGVVLVHLWRLAGGITESSRSGTGTTLAQQFLQLVELHYRDHLGVDDFARLLGVRRSTLHETCLKVRQRTPLALLHDRIIEEARSRLETTDLPVEQIGFGLGFRDPAYFNRFFRRLTGMTPRAFRQSAVRRKLPQSSFAAWP